MSAEYELGANIAELCNLQLSENQNVESTVSEVFERAQIPSIAQNQDNKRVIDDIRKGKEKLDLKTVKIQPPVPPPRPDPALYNRILISSSQHPVPNEKKDSSSTVVESAGNVQAEANTESNVNSSPPVPVNTYNPKRVTSATQPKILNPDEPLRGGRKSIGKWQLGKTIGEGSSGKVKLAQHEDTKETCVVKAVRRPKLPDGTATANVEDLNKIEDKDQVNKIFKRELYMIREACLGMMLNHPNVVKLHSAVLGENHFYCFFELVEGEDLVDFISRNGPIPEVKARKYIHRNHVAHRDIKLENIRFNNVTGMVKLLDFGFASFYSPKHLLRTNCGSPCYASPEIYDNKPYDPKLIDIWSLGVCLFGMVTGSLPFDGNDFKSLAASVKAGKVTYPEKCVPLSKGVTDLIASMLKADPRKRITIAGVVKHYWTNFGHSKQPIDYYELPNRSADPTIDLHWVKCLQAADMCQAGCILMNELMERIPSKKSMDEGRGFGPAASCESTDEEDSIREGGSKFLSNMTIKDKKLSNIWWKRLFHGIIGSKGKKVKQQQEAPPLPPRPSFDDDSLINAPGSGKERKNAVTKKFRAYTSAAIDLLTPSPSNNTPKRRMRFPWFRK